MNLRSVRLLTASLAFAAMPVLAQNAATVNGKGIPSARVDAIVKQLVAQGQKDTPQLREMIKADLIGREVLLQEAAKKGITNRADVKEQIENSRQMIVIAALRDDFVKAHPVTDAEIKAEYDRYKQAAGDTDYKVRHILVGKEQEAKDIIVKLNGGTSFEELAKQSLDRGTAGKGGDLDWGNPAKYVKPFSDAVVKLKKGQYTETPVKTEFGYHVIKLDDTRSSKLPPLDEIKQQVAKVVMERKLQEYQSGLFKSAKIK